MTRKAWVLRTLEVDPVMQTRQTACPDCGSDFTLYPAKGVYPTCLLSSSTGLHDIE